jgi:hypothetical protein
VFSLIQDRITAYEFHARVSRKSFSSKSSKSRLFCSTSDIKTAKTQKQNEHKRAKNYKRTPDLQLGS